MTHPIRLSYLPIELFTYLPSCPHILLIGYEGTILSPPNATERTIHLSSANEC